ncbi:MAG: hypothetical protein FJX06_17950 [Alphaproteobacteria bacterium]|nr:hypothetical protein [Alphaproteobacteria bacterium]
MNQASEITSLGVALPGEHVDDLLRRPEAAEYLRRRYAIGTTAENLSAMAGRGNGPAYRKIMGTCIYRRGDIDAWIIAKISAPIERRAPKASRSAEPAPNTVGHLSAPLSERERAANAA